MATTMEAKPNRVYFLAFLLLAFPVLYSIDWKITEWKFWTYRITLGAPALFIFLALVPGVLAIVYHLVTVVQRRNQNHAAVDAYYAWRNARNKKLNIRAHQNDLTRADDGLRTPVSANAATILLVSVFLFVAIVAGYTDGKGALQGIIYSGLGAYVAVLYFMVSRLYASALSSRFLMASAIGSSVRSHNSPGSAVARCCTVETPYSVSRSACTSSMPSTVSSGSSTLSGSGCPNSLRARRRSASNAHL